MSDYVVVGALVRIDQERRQEVCSLIEAMEGFSTFEVEDPLKMGVLIEADSLDEAHARFSDQLTAVDGVLGAWPVSVDCEEQDETDCAQESSLETRSRHPMAAPDPAAALPSRSHPENNTHTPSFKSEANA